MFGECHAHVFLNGIDYKKAVETHKDHPNEKVIRETLKVYQDAGVTFVRDGGDHYGVSSLAAKIAPEYNIDYRTPVFAIHKKGQYGSIVGLGFDNIKEYYELVKHAKSEGADFIKVMTSGLLDFDNEGRITGTPINAKEVKEMVHIAHEEGMAIMSHTNGTYGVMAAIEAGADSIEHGNFIDESVISMFADSDTVWVPTLVTIRNLKGVGRYDDKILDPIISSANKALELAYQSKIKVAPGSDAGAFMVHHGMGISQEVDAIYQILGDTEEVKQWLLDGENKIKEKFCRQ